jgi:hypothetical protein
MSHAKRITVIARDDRKPGTDWRLYSNSPDRVVVTDSFSTLGYMLRRGMKDMNLDVERFVIDRAAPHADFLVLLATIPEDFAGDVLFISEDGGGFLSATSRSGGRVLYALGVEDVRFYLEAHDLVTGRVALDREQRIA